MKIVDWFKNLNLPNKLTVIRVMAIPLFLLFLYISKGIFRFLPLLIFAGAAVTDLVDGYIARRDNLVSDFGKFMDPL
jgi:CDP-diacylglycerol--glycerol-3-phosphate 3-phosphatidyltransferase